MVASTPEELSKWLTERLASSPVVDFIPAANLPLVTSQIVAACYQNGQLQTADLLSWFEKEFEVPRETLMPVMSGLKKEAAQLGVLVLLPWENSAAVQAPPPTPRTVAAPAARPAPPPSPPPSDKLPAAQYLTDSAYLELSVFDYLVNETHPEYGLTAKILVQYFQLGPDEIEILRTARPGAKEDSLAGWCLRLGGLTLGLRLASYLARDMPERQPEWSRGVRIVQAQVSETASAILARQQKARAENDPALPLLQSAWNRVRQAAEALDRDLRSLTGKEAPASPPVATPRPPRPATAKAAPIPGQTDRKRLIIAVVGILAMLVAMSYAVLTTGVLSSGAEEKEVALDTGGLALPILRSYTSGGALVAVVDEAGWKALSEQGQADFLLALYDRAVKVAATQVQLRSAGDQILAQAWSREKFKLFTKN